MRPGFGVLAALSLWATLALAGMAFFVLGVAPANVSGGGAWVVEKILVAWDLEKLPIICVEFFGTIFLAGFAARLGVRESGGWIMFLVIFLPRVFIPWRDVGFIHNTQLYVLGMWVSKWPLAKSDQVKALVRMYWPLLVGLLLALHMPGYSGRCDKFPVATWFHRFRWYSIESIILIVFFTGALNTSGDAYGLTKWLGPWALFAYCFHEAADRLLPRPWATAVTFASMGVFYLIARRTQHSKDSGKTSEAADVKLDGRYAADRGGSESSVERVLV